MPSSLEADGVKGYLLFARLVIWMQLSDRVARGEFDFWCILHINLLLQEVILFFLSQRATERTSSTMHRDFWTFNFCKLCILTIAMFFAQKNEFARLIVDVESGCGNVHLLWTLSTIQCLNNLYVGTLISVMEYTALCRTIWLV